MSVMLRKIIQFYIWIQKSEDSDEIVKIFKEIDTNNDGYITPKEMEKSLNKRYPNATIGN